MQRKHLWIVIAAATVVVVAAAGGGAYVLLRTKGGPAQTASAFLSAWDRGDLAAMRLATVTPPPEFDRQYQRLRGDFGVTKVHTTLGRVTKRGDHATAPFSAELTLPAGTWRYQGRLVLKTADRHWKVDWSPEAVHPDLHDGGHFVTSYRWPQRAKILAANGTAIDGGAAPAAVQHIVGGLGRLTDKQAKHLGSPYKRGDVVGTSGMQQRYDKRLSGSPTATISVADASNHPVKAVGTFPGTPGRTVKTTLDTHIEQAAVNALLGQAKPTSLVAIRPSTGQIVGFANAPPGYDRAMQGIYAPGSTFKVVTAYALLQGGLNEASRVQCPKVANVGGQTIHNSEGEELGDITFKDALAQSCNTAFALQTHRLLSPAKLASAAGLFGFNQKVDPGVKVTPGSFPSPTSDAEMAVAGFGQGRDLSNALSMAGVAAGVSSGTWRPPTFVTEPHVAQKAKEGRLDPGIRDELVDMMHAVVTSGTAKPAGLPPGTAGKTGTAEYGSGKKPPTHAWFMGFRDDIAFAVVVEGGGFGAKAAAPVAKRFLNGL